MGQITPSFLFDVESRMRIVSAREYERFAQNSYWTRIAKEITSTGKRERLIWLLDSAKIEYSGDRFGGVADFSDILSNTTEYTAQAADEFLTLNKYDLEDLDGGGVEAAAHWARQMGLYAAYWPQKQVMTAIRNGGASTSLSYDSQIFFSTAHPLNPFDSSLGTYANDFTGSASGAYPGACPIDSTNATTVDTALQNLQKVIRYIEGILMPNGEDPRFLKARTIIAPPALSLRVQQLTNAKFIAQAAGSSGGGSGDIEAVIRNWNFDQPQEAPELGATVPGGSDTTFYIVASTAGSDEVGALTYVNRNPFEIVYNSGMTDSELQRANKLQWSIRGRNTVGYGHPYLIFRVQAT
jgi:phage major head subunit gpT-like protein